MTLAPDTLPARLAGKRIGLLLENEFVDEEISYYRRRFAEEGAEVVLLSRLWGRETMDFTGVAGAAPVTATVDVDTLDYGELSGFAALIVPSGSIADRLRYSEDVDALSPAVNLLGRAFRMPHLVKAFSCHALLLASPSPDLVRGRTVTCHNNLIGDARNMGALYTNQDVVVDRDLVTSRTVEQCHLLARAVIAAIEADHGR
ncbi:DJ-1/PfpI family protein [Actinospica acidithermotolerans]